MAKATIIVAGGASTYSFPFDYLSKQFVKVTVIAADGTTTTDKVYNVDYSVEDKTVTFKTTAPLATEKVKIYRETSTTKMVSFVDASILRAKDLNTLDYQVLHLMEEEQDYIDLNAMSFDTQFNAWNAKSFRIENVADPVADQDIVPYGFVKGIKESALASENAALASENAAKASENAAKASENAAKASENAASTSATNASSSASSAASSASDANTAKVAAQAVLTATETARDAANSARNDAQTAANNASTSQSAASSSAVAAATYATNAATSETNAATSATSAGASQVIVKGYMDQLAASALSVWGNPKNLLDNAGFAISQQWPTVNLRKSVDGYRVCDRWIVANTAPGYMYSQLKTTGASDYTDGRGRYNSIQLDTGTAITPTGSMWFGLIHRLMGGDIAGVSGFGYSNARSFSLSFYVKVSVAGVYSGRIDGGDKADFTTMCTYGFDFTVPTANVWTRISVPIPAPTGGTHWWETLDSLRVVILVGCGPDLIGAPSIYKNKWSYDIPTSIFRDNTVTYANFLGTAGATFQFMQPQLEWGNVVTPWEPKFQSVWTELRNCQRYYERSYMIGSNNNGYGEGVADPAGALWYNVMPLAVNLFGIKYEEKIVSPSIRVYSGIVASSSSVTMWEASGTGSPVSHSEVAYAAEYINTRQARIRATSTLSTHTGASFHFVADTGY